VRRKEPVFANGEGERDLPFETRRREDP